MDPLDALALARALVDIDSTTGREQEAGAWLAGVLREFGYHVVEQDVGGARMNVFATRRHPVVVLSTHYDCVPPFIPAHGRETGRSGAAARATRRASWPRRWPPPSGCAADGEAARRPAVRRRRGARQRRRAGVGRPGRAGAATSSTASRRTTASGRPRRACCASGCARQGARPIRRIRSAASRPSRSSSTRSAPFAPSSGRRILYSAGRSYAVGLITGGVAHNVIPPSADAEVTIRLVGPSSDVLDCLRPIAEHVSIERGLEVPAVRMETVPGFPSAAFAYTTDVPFLAPWGTPLLLGPGSIHHAHTPERTPAAGRTGRRRSRCTSGWCAS